MCLALPARIVEIPDTDTDTDTEMGVAVVDMGGVRKRISIALVPEAQLGDFVIVHVGHAIGMLDEEEALASLALFAELAQSQNDAEAAKP